MQYLHSGGADELGMKISKLTVDRIKILYTMSSFENLPDPNNYPMWVYLGCDLEKNGDIWADVSS